MEKSLDLLTKGEKGVIKLVKGEGVIRRRLFDMGVTPGAEVELVKKAPLGDPLEYKIRNYALTLRKKEAENVIVDIKEDAK